jgi:hypothetical protein
MHDLDKTTYITRDRPHHLDKLHAPFGNHQLTNRSQHHSSCALEHPCIGFLLSTITLVRLQHALLPYALTTKLSRPWPMNHATLSDSVKFDGAISMGLECKLRHFETPLELRSNHKLYTKYFQQIAKVYTVPKQLSFPGW